MSLLRLFILGSLVTSTVSCSGGAAVQSDGDAPPNWFLNPGEAYSQEQYLTAVGSGASPQEAQNEAFGNLARIFEADIQASQALRDDYREVRRDGAVTGTQQDTRLMTRADVTSNQKLLNSEVLEQARARDTYYALVGMDRSETIRIYAQEIESNRRKIEEYRTAAQDTDNFVTRLAFLRQALVLARVNKRLVTQRNIVAAGSAPDRSSSPVTALEKALRNAQEDCPVVVAAKTDDVPPSLLDQIGATLETAGFGIIDRPEEAILEARVSYRERPALESREEEFLRWTLAIERTAQTTRQTLNTFTSEQRAEGMSNAAVQRRAHYSARRAIEKEFLAFLDQTLLNIDQ